MSAEIIQLEKLRAPASVVPSSVNEKARTVDVTFYTGAEIMRWSWAEGEFNLVFSLDPKHVVLERLNGGAPVLDSHNSGGVSSIFGVVVRAWISNGKGYATLRFSERAEVEPVWRDVLAGVIRNVSMGAIVHQLTDVTPKGAKVKTYRATKWEPAELSLVAVPADAGAQTLAAGERFPCELIGGPMDPTKIITTDPAADVATERARSAEILRACRVAKLEPDVAETLIANGATIEKAQSEIFRLMAERDEAQPIRSTITVGAEYGAVDGPHGISERMAQALAWRASPTGDLPDAARQFARSSASDCAAELLSARGFHVRGASKSRVVDLALSTTDYPNLLANTANKLLIPAYEAAKPTYLLLCARRDLRDFKPANVVKVGDFPLPLEVPENGAIQLGYFSESNETWSLLTYGRRIGISRQALVNDDLGGFGVVMNGYARRLRDFENALFFTLLTSAAGAGPTMGDSVALFHSTHGNLGSATAITVDSLGAGRAAMQKQASLDGVKLNLLPRFLLVSPDKLTLAEQYLTGISPSQPSNANPFPGRLTAVSDANLAGNPWYLWADPSVIQSALFGYLEGEPGPRVSVRQGHEIEGVDLRVGLDFAVTFAEHRGLWRNPGA